MGEGLFQPMHLLIILVIALLVFGPKKLPELGKGSGEAIRGFKDAFKSSDAIPPTKPTDSEALSEAKSQRFDRRAADEGSLDRQVSATRCELTLQVAGLF